jgi:hypothetical protein
MPPKTKEGARFRGEVTNGGGKGAACNGHRITGALGRGFPAGLLNGEARCLGNGTGLLDLRRDLVPGGFCTPADR